MGSNSPDHRLVATSRQRISALLLRGLFVLTFLVYARTIAFDFVYDDHVQIVMNPWLDSWSRIPSFFTHQLWAFSDFHTPANFYRPVFLSWLSVVGLLTGGAPAWYHLFTLLAHLVVVGEAYLLARLLRRDSTTALIAAALFALHPAKVEAVAWISGGGEPLYAVFFFATFIAYLHGRETSTRVRWTVLACLFFLVALFTKEQAIVLPGILAVYEFFRLRDERLGLRIVKTAVAILPFVMVAAAYWIARSLVVHGVTEFAHDISIRKTLLTQPLAWTFYLRHLVLPVGLSVMYPAMIIREFSVTRVLIPALILAVVVTVTLYFARKTATGALLAAWFFLTLAPPAVMVLLLQPHDRYLYLPSFAFSLAVAALIRKHVPEGRALAVSVGAICLVLAVATFHQSGHWDNDVTLWERAVVVSPASAPARVALASSYAQDGDLDRALIILQQAAKIDPTNYDVWHALGVQEYSRGHYSEALPYLKTALENATQDYQRTMCLYNMGIVAAHLQLNVEAEQWLRQSILLDPNSALTRNALAALLEGEGRRDEAHAQRLLAKQNAR